jgi:hypothetical protein
MTDQQTDIEKTLKRILARELPAWPAVAQNYPLTQGYDGSLFVSCVDLPDGAKTVITGIRLQIADDIYSYGGTVTRAEWEAERALLASEQAQPLGDSEEFDQALWDKVAISFIGGSAADQRATWTERGTKEIVEQASNVADAFMAERAKRIAARKASHD